ncbi:hypothetical protein [uncultured Microbacterium sp.]|uniref:hypothetical protein n=1 Tax=uncultured Microbacterium sp. TaxID=191216 RepID=UPI00262C9804|nr:hypothetical protein [uncultured Microbacterium sp.]
MSSTPVSIRFDDDVLDRVRRSAAVRDTTASSLIQRYVEEALRTQDFPGIVFRDGPAGRRAALAVGPDVWEIASALRDVEQRGDAAIEAVAVDFSLSPVAVRLALSYYGAHAAEIDAEVAENDRAAEVALASWKAQQRLVS